MLGGGGDRVGFGVLLGGATFAFFGTIDATVKWLSAGHSVFLITFFLSIGAMLPVAVLVSATGGVRTLRPRSPTIVMIRAVLMLIATLTIYLAFRTLSIAETYTLIFTGPLIVTVLSVPLLGERVGWRRWLAVIAGFAGILVMLRPGVNTLGIGHLAAFTSALTFALNNIILRRSGAETSSALLAPMIVVKAIGAGILMVVFGVADFPPWPDLGLMILCGLMYGCAHTMLIFAFRFAPAAVVAPFQYSQMVWGVIYGILIFGDWPDATMYVGALIVIGSGIYIALRERAHRRPEPSPLELKK